MSIAQRLVNLSDGLSAEGILSAAKGGTGTTTGAGSSTPTISAIGYGGDDTATNPAGGQTITLTGTNFASGAKVLINTTPVSVVTVVSATQITFTAPALAAGSYILYVVNLDGSTAIAVPGIQYSGTPAWTTAAGSLGTSYETAPVSSTVSAASDSTVTYSVVSGTLPSGVTINASGTISGTSPAVGGSTTYTFTVRATDLELQDTDRQFSLTINPDVVTWSSSNAFDVQQDAASTTTLSATSAAGQTVSYAVDTLPAGLTLSGAVVSGTATTAGTTTTTATATAAVTGKTAQQTITWTVSIAADAYWKYTTLLLNNETAVAPFLSDASTNNFSLTAVGDTKPSNFGPYTTGYYSVALDSQRHLSTPANSAFDFGSGDFTVEAWVYFKSYNSMQYSGHTIATNYENNNGWNFGFNGQNGIDGLAINTYSGNSLATAVSATGVNSSVVPLNKWHHVAVTKSGSTVRMFVNGVGYTTSGTYTTVGAGGRFAIGVYQQNMTYSGNPNWNISNLRVVKGMAVYTTDFTPPITPLTAITGTSLLACQGNRFVDASANAFPLTASSASNISVSSFVPFQPSSSYATYGSTYFDGTGDYLSSTAVSITPGSSDFCLEAWGYWTSFNNGTYGSPLISIGGGSPGGQLMLRANKTSASSTSANYYSQINGTFIPSAGYTSGVSAGTIYLNTWTHLALTRQGSTFRLFVNGELVSTQTDSQNYYVTFTTLHIGSDSSPANGYMTGWVADARLVIGSAVYTAAFTPPTQPLTAVAGTNFLTCQTNQPHTNNTFLDNSSNALAITRTGNATQGAFSPYGANWSNYFGNSTSDNIYAASNAKFAIGTGNFTVEAFVNFSAPSSTGRIFLQGVSGTDGLTIAKNSSTSLEIGISGGYITYTWTPIIGQWYHIAVVRSGTGTGQVALYIDGQVVTTGTSAASIAQNPVFIGGLNWAAGYNFPGYISNVRYSNIARTITVPTAPYQADANTLLLTCQSPNFVDNSHNAFTITNSGTPSTQKFSPFANVTQTPVSHSVYFDGSGDYLQIANNSAFNFGTGDFTVECWANHSVTSQIQSMVSTYQGSTAGWLFQWRSDTGKLALGHGDTQLINYTFTPTVGTWYHYAVSRTGTSLKLFINGTVVATVTDSTNITSTASLVVGNISTTIAQYTYGYLSNLRVVKGTAVYTSNFTPTTQPLTAVSGTSLLTCQDATIRDNSANNFALTAAGNATPRRQNPFGWTTSSAQDYTPSVFGNSAYFDGTGDYLSYTGSLSLTGAFTVQGWFYNTSTSGAQQTLFVFNSASGNGYGSLRADCDQANTQFNFSVNMSTNGSSWATTLSTNNAYIKNVWNHFAVTRDSSNAVKVFINGVQIASGTQAGTLYNTSTTNAIGCNNLPGTATNPFNGYISDLQLINGTALYTANFVPPAQPLTAVQNTTLLLNMDKSAIQDKSGKVVLETVGDVRLSTAQKKYGTSSMYFDGTGDYMVGANNPNLNLGTGAFTIEAWIYRVSGTGSTDWRLVGGSVDSSFFFGGRNTYSLGFGRSAVAWDLESASNVYSPDTWTHVVYVRNSSGNINIYVNGTSVASTTNSNNYGLNGGNFQVCAEKGGQNFGGYIDDLRISRYARYTANFTPPQQALLTK